MDNKEINISSTSLKDAKLPTAPDSMENKFSEIKTEPIKISEPKVKKENIFKRILFKIKNAKKSSKIIAIVIIALVGLSIGGTLIYLAFFQQNREPESIIDLKQNYIETSIITQGLFVTNKFPIPGEPKIYESPITGELFTKTDYERLMTRRPVAVIINNHYWARPQSNLNEADLVFETIAESGITRYLAIFWSNDVNKTGPIRSARQYFIEWLSPFDALFIHDGFAYSTDPRINAGGNIINYGIKDIATDTAWREYDGRRYAPHNEYASVVSAWDIGETKGWDGFPPNLKSLKFKRDATFDNRGDKTKIQMTFWTDISNNGAYDVEWEYEKSTNTYLRKVGGQIDIDQESNTQIRSKNVIIQLVNMTSAYDAEAHVIITTIGEGEAKFLIDGKIINGTWRKTDRVERTRYYNESGDEIEFNRGITWVEALPKDQGTFDIIEQ